MIERSESSGLLNVTSRSGPTLPCGHPSKEGSGKKIRVVAFCDSLPDGGAEVWCVREVPEVTYATDARSEMGA